MQSRRLAIGLAILFLILAPTASILADGPMDRTSRAEMRFLEGLIDHSQIAISMAQNCLEKSKTQAVRQLCQSIPDAQAAHIKVMRGWLLVWYQIDYLPASASAASMSMMSMMGMNGMNNGDGGKTPMPMMPTKDAGMMGQGQAAPQQSMMPTMGVNQNQSGDGSTQDPNGVLGLMAGLNKLTDRPYEIAWLEAEIDHDTAIIDLAGHAVKDARHQELHDLAQIAINEQTAEIKTLNGLIGDAAVQ